MSPIRKITMANAQIKTVFIILSVFKVFSVVPFPCTYLIHYTGVDRIQRTYAQYYVDKRH